MVLSLEGSRIFVVAWLERRASIGSAECMKKA